MWWGGGAASLGLTGPVTPASFAGVLEGRDPDSARALRATRGDRSVAGYDLTFCAPKSVSLLHLLAPREIAEAASTGHHRAVADALDYLGREGVGVRRSREGHVAFLPTTGPVAGGFLHRTSRALDPHLHTHVVVANVAKASTACGPGWTADDCISTSEPPSRSTTPVCASSWATGWGRHGSSVLRVSVTSPASTPGCAGSSPSGHPPWTSSGTVGGS